jgi:hypothetical protein
VVASYFDVVLAAMTMMKMMTLMLDSMMGRSAPEAASDTEAVTPLTAVAGTNG